MRSRGKAALFVVLMLAGCATPGDPGTGAPGNASTGSDALAEGGWRPHPKPASEAPLRPGSAFRETEWGYVRSDWKEPATIEPTVFYMEGYNGASVPAPTHYLRMRDGTLLALNVMPHDQQTPVDSDMPRFPGYTQVRASLRGTGCSGGSFTIFDGAGADDGYEAIEWIAQQNWTTPKVGMYGASYSGLTAFYVAATQPPHLAAVVPNLVIDDYYRGIGYPGGILNNVFPFAWMGTRQGSDSTGTSGGAREQDEVCSANVRQHGQGSPADQVGLILASHPYDDLWYQRNSLYAFAPRIRAPTSIAHGWQDEQTGPRGGARLFDLLPDDIPKRLVATNGLHANAAQAAYADDLRWFDQFLKGIDSGVLAEPPVVLRFDTRIAAPVDPENYTWLDRGLKVEAAVQRVDAFPPRDTEWTRLYLRAGGKLSPEAPSGAEAPDAYAAGAPRRSWYAYDERPDARTGGPDVVAYVSEPLAAPMVVAGPIAATLHVSATANDADLYVAIADVHPDGRVTYLTRGLLRASHRALDETRSEYNAAGDLVVPHHPHTRSDPVTPGEILQVDVEVFPLAHIFREGHRVRVEVSNPPLVDGLWGYSPLRTPGLVQVHHEAGRASSVLFPVIEWSGEMPPEEPCGDPVGYSCSGSSL